MKKALSHARKTPSILLVALLIFIIAVFSFGSPPGKGNSPNAPFSTPSPTDPPIAQRVTVTTLAVPTPLGNMLLRATFDIAEARSKMPDNLLTINLSTGPVTLNDQGKDGDEKEGDGVFSLIFNEKASVVSDQLGVLTNDAVTAKSFLSAAPQQQAENLSIAPTQAVSVINFTGRTATNTTVSTNQLFANDAFVSGAETQINPLTFSSISSSAALDSITRDRVLMIRDLRVIEDPTRTNSMCCCASGCCCSNGRWTFGYLMKNIANQPLTGVTQLQNVQTWLEHWMNLQTINGEAVPARDGANGIFNRVIAPWVRRSNPGAVVTRTNWKTFNLNYCHAPFRLLAIVPRFDLRENLGYAGGGGARGFNAGEGRFVFGIMDSTLCFPLVNISKGTVIFEYGLPFSNCLQLVAYAKRWHSLRLLVPGSAAYNNLLDSLTDVFTRANAAPGKPNGSALNQLRTNELALGTNGSPTGGPWELREFKIVTPNTPLREVVVANTPQVNFNRINPTNVPANVTTFTNWANTTAIGVPVPLTFPGAAPFQGAKSHTLFPPTPHSWDGNVGAILPRARRHDIALNTCDGCHGGEGNTAIGNLLGDPATPAPANSWPSFVHIAPTSCGFRPLLSAFLTGDPAAPGTLFQIADPVDGAPTRGFNDLLRRANDLRSLIKFGCGSIFIADVSHILLTRPLVASH